MTETANSEHSMRARTMATQLRERGARFGPLQRRLARPHSNGIHAAPQQNEI